MKTISKALVGTVAAGAMAISAASPAQAQYRTNNRDHDGISVGDVIAGAVIIGGIAAIASASSRNGGYNNGGYNNGGYYNGGYDNSGYDNRYGNNRNRYGYRGDPRQAVEQCVSAATSQAGRYGRAQVTRITQVKDRNNGWEVKGEISVNGNGGYNGGGYNGGYNDRSNDRYGYGNDNRYGNNYRYGNDNRYGYGDRYGYNDSGSFKCQIDRGQIYDLDFSGLRGL